MPIVEDKSPNTSGIIWGVPVPNREPIYYRFLSASVKINVQSSSGSGTIIYYDKKNNEAYVISCGHLWNGSRDFQSLQTNPEYCNITIWHQNNQKLNEPKKYRARVLFWSNERGYDSSLLKFTPDWVPNFFSIAPSNYLLNSGFKLNSCGCDGGEEVARYEVEFVEYRGLDLITTKNSPRPGRSGGGLLTDDGLFVGICWGTSNVSGTGIGYFTPLSSIHKIFNEQGFSWLLNNQRLAQRIPILDRNNNQQEYESGYISSPNLNSFNIP